MATEDLQLRKTPRQSRARMTLESILETATRHLKQVGFDELTVEAVALDCGVATGTFYEYFRSKATLVAELRRRHNEEVNNALRDAVGANLDTGGVQAIRQIVKANIDVHQRDPELHRLLTVDYANVGVDPDDADPTTSFFQAPDSLLGDHFAEALSLSAQDAKAAAQVVFVVSESLTHAAVVDNHLALRGDELADHITWVIEGYLERLARNRGTNVSPLGDDT